MSPSGRRSGEHGDRRRLRERPHRHGGGGGSNITFVGPVTARTFRSDRADNVVVDDWNVDCNGCVNVQIFHIEAANNVIVRNSEIQDNTDNSLIWINGSNITFENNKIHDAGLRSGSGAHTECMYVWSVTNLTLKRNHFYHCAVMDVFITGSAVANGGYVENNVFEKPWSTTGQLGSGLAFHFRNGGDPSPDPNNWDFRYNTFIGPLSISGENPVGSGGMRVIGNVFLSGAACGKSNTTYSYNAFVSGGCGTNSITNSLATYQSGFVSTADPGNFALTSGSVLRDKGTPTGYPTQDRPGNARTRNERHRRIRVHGGLATASSCAETLREGPHLVRPLAVLRASGAPRSGSSSARAPSPGGSRRRGRAASGRGHRAA